MLNIVDVLKKQVNFGTEFTKDPLLKSQTENSNTVTLAGFTFVFICSISNFLDNHKLAGIKLLIYALILLFNRIFFSYIKKVKIYTSIIIFVICFCVCETIITGVANGAGIISIGVLITSVMYISKYRFGFILSICLILFEIFIIFFNSKIEWIYTYPKYMEIYFLRFIGAHLGGFIISYFGLKKQKELYNEVKKEKELRGRFFVNIVHDLKTPLTVIHNSVDQLVNGDMDDNTKKGLRSNINRMEKDVLNILKIDRLERGFHTEDRNIITNISTLTFDICDLFKNYAQSRGIKIITKVKSNVFLRIDQTSYTEILNNLIENAIKYSNREASIIVSLDVNNNQIQLNVEDSGVGIDSKDIKHIFNSYYQADDSYDSYYGLGIGLAITKEICEIWDGAISVQSIKNEGTIFTINFPLPSKDIDRYSTGKVLNTPLDTFFPEIEIPQPNKELQTILIVDDNLDIRNLLIKCFKERYNLIVAKNGEDALEKYSSAEKIDLIISDLMMPVMDGKEFITRLLNREGGLVAPIIVLTAKSGSENSFEYLSLGAIDFLSKPFSTSELEVKVESLLNVFKNREDDYIENINSNIISFISDKCYIKAKTSQSTLDYEKLRTYSITSKEQIMIEHIKNGLSYKEIAFEEKVSVNTVKTHIYRIYKKCDINNYSSLVKLFYS